MSEGVYVCDDCGSSSVSTSANIWWSEEKQNWSVGDHHDYTWCEECGGESGIDMIYYNDHPDAVGTRKAVLVEHVQQWGNEAAAIFWAAGVKHYTQNPGEKWEDLHDTLVILEKISKWQWKIVEDEIVAN